jgi:hypothetical protein
MKDDMPRGFDGAYDRRNIKWIYHFAGPSIPLERRLHPSKTDQGM